MPPKGWRKDAQGNYPTTSYIKEQENITIDDLLFPKSIIVGLAKEVQANTDPSKKLVINKDAATALQRSATIFVNHLLLFAREIAKDQEKKSCNVDDVLAALDLTGFPGLKNIVMDKLNDYQRAQTIQKEQKQLNKEQNMTEQAEKSQQNEEMEADVGVEETHDQNDDANENFTKKARLEDGTIENNPAQTTPTTE